MKKIDIKYFTDIEPLEQHGDWIDLRAAEDVKITAGEFKLIPLGVGMKLPKGYEAIVAPRSSTFKNFGLLQVNSVGVIDGAYCGDTDQWMMPVVATRDVEIHKNDRICQFRILKNHGAIKFNKVDSLNSKSRGGFGSSGVK